MQHNLFKDEKSYIQWARRVAVEGSWLTRGEIDWQLRDDLVEFKPVRYPVITVTCLQNDFSRGGDIGIRIFEHVYLDEFDESFDPYVEEKAQEAIEHKKHKYWIELENLRDLQESGASTEIIQKLVSKIKRIRRNLEKEGITFHEIK